MRRVMSTFVTSLPPPMLYTSPGCAALDQQIDGAAVVEHVQPVAHVAAVAVERHRQSVDRVGDEERDELLGKLVRPVVVRRAGDRSTGTP